MEAVDGSGKRPGGSICLFPSRPKGPFDPLGAIAGDAFDVVDQAVEGPLDVDLGFAAVGEVIHALLRSEVGEDGFDDGGSFGVDGAALWEIDLGPVVGDPGTCSWLAVAWAIAWRTFGAGGS